MANSSQVLVGIGVCLLFFLVGLDEIDTSVLVNSLRARFLLFVLSSLLTPALLSFLVLSDLVYDFGLGLEPRAALALATILSLSSLGIAAKVLADGGHLRDPLGVRILNAILLFKFFCLPLVGFMYGDDGGDLSPLAVLTLFAKVACFGFATYLISNRVLPPAFVVLKRFLHVPHLSFGLVLGTLFLTVACAELLNLHGSVGALLFGAALSGLPCQVRREVVPGLRSMADGLFIPLFFVTGGLQTSFAMSELPVAAAVAIAIVPLVGKFGGPFLGALATRMENPAALATGLMAKGITEIALLLVLVEHGMIGRDLFSWLMLVMFAYVMGSPPLITFVLGRTKRRATEGSPALSPFSLTRFALIDVAVREILEVSDRFPGPDQSVRDLVEHWLVPGQHDYVVATDGRVAGMVSTSMLRCLPMEAWSTTPLREVTRELTESAWDDEHVEDVLQRMQEGSVTTLPVLERKSGKLIGSVTSQEILDLILRSGGGHV